MKLDWFNAREAVAFAKEIAQDINKHFPPASQDGKPSNAKKNLGKFIEKVAIRTHLFKQQHKLNMYKKVKFLDTVKRELSGAGHEEAFINEAIHLLMPIL